MSSLNVIFILKLKRNLRSKCIKKQSLKVLLEKDLCFERSETDVRQTIFQDTAFNFMNSYLNIKSEGLGH